MIKYLIIVTVCCFSFVLCATASVVDQAQMTTMSDTELEDSYRETLDTYFSKNKIPQELRDLIANKFISLSQWTFLNQYYCCSSIRLFRQLVDRVSQSEILIKTEELWEFCLYLCFRNMERQSCVFAKKKHKNTYTALRMGLHRLDNLGAAMWYW